MPPRTTPAALPLQTNGTSTSTGLSSLISTKSAWSGSRVTGWTVYSRSRTVSFLSFDGELDDGVLPVRALQDFGEAASA